MNPTGCRFLHSPATLHLHLPVNYTGRTFFPCNAELVVHTDIEDALVFLQIGIDQIPTAKSVAPEHASIELVIVHALVQLGLNVSVVSVVSCPTASSVAPLLPNYRVT
ncbi:MAG: hypothetical protein KAJ53_01995, partial [Anaerolineales bacterium]|nr:hypothetical protein [Anaerolineales bacterium]